MFKTLFLFFALSACTVSNTFAQDNEFQKLRDTFLAAIKKKPTLTAYLDGRSSFVNSSPANVFGLFVGYNYGRRVDVGLAYYTTAFSKQYDITINKGTSFELKGTRSTTFGYLAAKVEYTFYKTKHWEFAVPLSLGIGKGFIEDFFVSPSKVTKTTLTIVPLETGISGIYLFYDWIGVSAGLSYRLNFTNWQYFNEFTAMNYTGGISIRFGTLWKHIKRGPKHWYKGCRNSCCLF